MIRYYIKRIKEEKRPLKFLLSRFLWRTGLCRLFKIKQEGYELYFSPTSLSANMWVYPENFIRDEARIENFVKEGDGIIDIGANVGSLSLFFASKVGKSGEIYSFEAHPRTYHYLVKNVSLNRFNNVQSFNIALGREVGHICFSDVKSDDMNCVTQGDGIMVKVDKLDNVIDAGYISLIKLDTEGYELPVLQGAHKVLSNTSVIYFESYEDNFQKYNYSTCDLVTFLRQCDFVVCKLNDGHFCEIDPKYISNKCENLFAFNKNFINDNKQLSINFK